MLWELEVNLLFASTEYFYLLLIKLSILHLSLEKTQTKKNGLRDMQKLSVFIVFSFLSALQNIHNRLGLKQSIVAPRKLQD